jgi:uncharacterized cupredoxin-like copper-binding protein
MTSARRAILSLTGAALVLLPACAGSSGSDGGLPPLHRARTVHVTIRWSRFHPSQFAFPDGTTVRFVIRNTDPIEHEFILGSKVVQNQVEHTAHADHDGSVPGQITVPPGSTRTTTYRFGSPGTVLLGCHLPGHYAYGMRGLVTVQA